MLPVHRLRVAVADIYDQVEWPEEDTRIVGVRLVREESGDYEVEYEFEGGFYADRPDPPASIAEVQAAVRAAPPGARILARGRGTKPPLSTPPEGAVALDVSGLSGIIEYEPGEFTFTALAGTPIAEIAAALAEHGQFLPFDPPLVEAGATLGGTVAAGLSGPGRYRYGGVRDFILGVRYVDGTGEVVRTGGKVVKNAAGFDISKLMVGSLGALGVLVELSFKVFPKPEAYATLCVPHPTLDDALATLHRLTSSQMDFFAIDLEPAPDGASLWVRLGGLTAALPERLERLRGLAGEGDVLVEDADAACWRAAREFTWRPEDAALVKVPVTPGRIARLESDLTGLRNLSGLAVAALQRGRPGGLARVAARGAG